MNKIILFILLGITIFGGIIFVGIHDQWIIIRNPLTPINKLQAPKKTVKTATNLFYWHNNAWNREQASILLSENQSNNIMQLINAWLSFMEAEELIEKKVTLESALISSTGQELFLSFSQNMFGKDESLFSKWMQTEGILKTIRENSKNQVQTVRFLVRHQPLRDTQLDFSFSWPIQGFCKN